MKNTLKTLATLSILAAFVMLNWATSQEIENVTLNAEAAIFQDSLIIFNNLDAIDIVDAELTLIAPESENFEDYVINNYNLAAMTSDTLQMTDFRNADNEAYPNNITPNAIDLFFMLSQGDVVVVYSSDL